MKLTFVNPADEVLFGRGAEWHSLDGGRTWKRGPAPEPDPNERKVTIRVTRVDHANGIIEVG